MQFAPFSFFGSQLKINNPNEISDLTFWVDFSDSNFYALSGSNITAAYNRVGDVQQFQLLPYGIVNPGAVLQYLQLTSSLSNPNLNCARVATYPTSYYSDIYVTGTPVMSKLVQGPKTNTTSYPDGMTFMVLNRGTYEDKLGYYLARFNGSVDRGAFFSENRTGGSYPPKTPQLTIGTYDQNSGIQYFDGSNNTANCILTRENNQAARTIFLGSNQVATNPTGNDTQTAVLRQFNALGKYYQGSQSFVTDEHPPINSYYCEVIQYNRVLTTEERTKVWNYLSQKWNVSL